MTKRLTSCNDAKIVPFLQDSGKSNIPLKEQHGDQETTVYRLGKYKFTVFSNKPSQQAIESFIDFYNDLFEKEVSRDNIDQDALSA